MSFLPLSSLQLLSKRLPPTPVCSTIFRVSGHLLPVPKGRQVLGPRRAAIPVQNPPLVAPKSGGFSACLFLGGDSGEAAKIWAPARSLVKKQTVFTFSKSNIPA